MATFDDLEAEVNKLRRKVRQLEGGNAAASNRRATGTMPDGTRMKVVKGESLHRATPRRRGPNVTSTVGAGAAGGQ
jgi:hypothetical protein